jgi:hypothetical protein
LERSKRLRAARAQAAAIDWAETAQHPALVLIEPGGFRDS